MLLIASWSEVSIVTIFGIASSEVFSSSMSSIQEIYSTPASSENVADICVLIEEWGRDSGFQTFEV